MKIALVVPGGVDRSGRERVVPVLLYLIEQLSRRHVVHVFVLDYHDQPCTYPLLGAVIHDLGRVHGPPGFRRVRLAHRLAAALRRHGPFDVMHAYWGMPSGAVAVAVGRRLKLPTVVTLSSGELVGINDIAYGLQRRIVDRVAVARMIRRASAISTPTAYMGRLLASYRVQAEIIPMGVETGRFRSGSRAEGPPWRLIRVGTLNAVKDYPTLLRAMAALPDTVTLDVIGEDRLDGATQALAKALGVDRRVTFHGWQPTERVAELYASAHLNVVSSRHEACNITMLEAACADVMTVGTAVGHVADWAPERAVAVPVQDPRALAAAITALLRDPATRTRIAAAARRWALAHDSAWTAQAFERLYGRVIRG